MGINVPKNGLATNHPVVSRADRANDPALNARADRCFITEDVTVRVVTDTGLGFVHNPMDTPGSRRALTNELHRQRLRLDDRIRRHGRRRVCRENQPGRIAVMTPVLEGA